MKISHFIGALTGTVVLAATGNSQAQPAAQLAGFVRSAIQSNLSTQAPLIAARAIGRLGGEEEAKAAAVITAALTTGDEVEVLAVVYAASNSNPLLAPTVASTAAGLFPQLAVPISGAAAGAAPTQAREIAVRVAEREPDQRERIFDVVRFINNHPVRALRKAWKKFIRSPEN